MTLDVYAQLQLRVKREHGRAFDTLVRQAREQLYGTTSGLPEPASDPVSGHESGHEATGGDRKAARSEPLAYLPAGSADVVFDLDTRAPLVALAVEQLAPRVTDGALTADQVHALAGGRAVVAMDAGKAWLAFATDAPAPRPRGGAAAAARDGVVVVAPSAADLRRPSTARRAPRHATRGRPSTSASRACRPMPARGSPSIPRVLLAQRSPPLAATPWARSLRDGAAVLTTRGTELRVPFRLTGDPGGLTPGDLPIASGPQPPGLGQRAARRGPARPGAHAGVRALRRAAVRARPARSASRLPQARPERPRPQRDGHEPEPRPRPSHGAHRAAGSRRLGDQARAYRHARRAGRQGRARRSVHRQARRRLHADPGRQAGRPRRRLRPRAGALQRPRREPPRGGGRAGMHPYPPVPPAR